MTLRGTVRTSYEVLTSRFGPPTFPQVDDGGLPAEDSTLWLIDTPAGRVHVHNWLDVTYFLKRPAAETRWSIQATDDAALPWIYKSVTGSTAAFSAGVHEFSRYSTRVSLARGYVTYLVQRMIALRERGERYDQGSREHRHQIELSRHVGHMALQVQQIVHDVEWAYADDADRRRWTTLPMPQLADEPESQHWHRWTRWTYRPVPTDSRPEGGDPDLVGMLRRRARDQVRFRDRILPANHRGPTREGKVELYDEHIGTLLTLADTALPDTVEQSRS
ncbi:hypothetical protein [Alloactinosynnema sp. L-07]|uniref:hypothetical protein n=1 Tax=Alloactinosynnema sp. L-07 TaxID=1653480 RepID=UPI0006B5DC16|nr:hypothetical protein [Alloactinosynnema sp. L-07]